MVGALGMATAGTMTAMAAAPAADAELDEIIVTA